MMTSRTTTSAAVPSSLTQRGVPGYAALVVVLLVINAMLAAGGQHGPGRHLPSGGAGGQTPATAQGVFGPGYGW